MNGGSVDADLLVPRISPTFHLGSGGALAKTDAARLYILRGCRTVRPAAHLKLR